MCDIVNEIITRIDRLNKQELERAKEFNVTPIDEEEAGEILSHPYSNHEYNKLMQKMRMNKFRKSRDFRDLTGENEEHHDEFNPDVHIYRKSWDMMNAKERLDKYEKYVSSLGLSADKEKELCALLKKSARKIKVTDVIYDTDNSKIISVKCLKHDPVKDRYYIEGVKLKSMKISSMK